MSGDKAREHFSALYEGTLEPGLKSVLERKLSMDAALQAEYRAFQRTMTMLDAMREEPIEIPIYLSDRIATRLEQAQEPTRVTVWNGWFSKLALGAAAVLVIGATARNVFLTGSGNVAEANIAGAPSASAPAFESSSQRNQAIVRYQSSRSSRCVVKDSEGTENSYLAAANVPFTVKLDNPNQEASIFEVTLGADQFVVAVPGQSLQIEKTGNGSLRDLAKAIADRYGNPVVMSRVDDTKTVAWTLDGTDAHAEVTKALEGANLTVTLTPKDTILISDR